jgi:hypothetical protein
MAGSEEYLLNQAEPSYYEGRVAKYQLIKVRSSEIDTSERDTTTQAVVTHAGSDIPAEVIVRLKGVLRDGPFSVPIATSVAVANASS